MTNVCALDASIFFLKLIVMKYFQYVQFIMVFDGSVLNRPIVAATLKDQYDKVLILLNDEIAQERVSGQNRVKNTYINI